MKLPPEIGQEPLLRSTVRDRLPKRGTDEIHLLGIVALIMVSSINAIVVGTRFLMACGVLQPEIDSRGRAGSCGPLLFVCIMTAVSGGVLAKFSRYLIELKDGFLRSINGVKLLRKTKAVPEERAGCSSGCCGFGPAIGVTEFPF